MKDELRNKIKTRMIFLDQFIKDGSNILNPTHLHNLMMLREYIIDVMKEEEMIEK